jgi:predicted ATPase
MIVSHVVLKNWRNFQSVDVDLGDRVFLVGPNASGKSNFLDAFRFLRDIAKPGGGLSKIRCLAARRYPDVEIVVDLAEAPGGPSIWRYDIGICQQARGYRYPLVRHEIVSKDGQVLLNRPDKEDRKDPLRPTQTHLEQISANADFRDIAKFLESVLYLHLVPQLVRHPEAFTGSGIPGDPYGRSFLERVARTPKITRQSRLRRIEDALRIAVPQLKELTYTQDETGIPHLEATYQHWRPRGGKQREDQFSDGTLRLLALLWSLMESDSLLLLEEPELSLNTAIVNRLAPLISRLQRQRKRQVIVSTHSADLLSDKGIGGEEAFLLKPGEEGTIVQRASDIREVRDLLEGGLSIADAAVPRTAPEQASQLEIAFSD